MKGIYFLVVLLSLPTLAHRDLGISNSPPRTVFIQLFEWSWKDIAKECQERLGPGGFSAVQVSPPQEHLLWAGNPWWTRYQPISYRIESRGGSERDFMDMVKACKQAGVDVYADVIFNHMAGMAEGMGFSGTRFTHFSYPGLYDFDDFHHCGRNGNNHIVDFTDLYELQNCMLVNLADLKTESPKVQNQIARYLDRLLEVGVSGFRIDAAKHMPARDIEEILRLLLRPFYVLQELIINSGEPVESGDYLKNGDITAYAYPYRLGEALTSGNLAALPQISEGLPRSEDAVVFVENHDTQRSQDPRLLGFLRDPELWFLGHVFMLTWPYGYPQLYSGFKFSHYDEGPPLNSSGYTRSVFHNDGRCRAPWTCEHQDQRIQSLVNFRNETADVFYFSNWWTNGSDQIAFGRGSKAYVVINGSNRILEKEFKTSLPQGVYGNLLDSTSSFSVSNTHRLKARLDPRSALVLLHKKPFVRAHNEIHDRP